MCVDGELVSLHLAVERKIEHQRHAILEPLGIVVEALGAYNAGPGRMDSFLAGKATLPDETKDYISRVLGKAGRTGDVNVGGITIHITQPGASADQIAQRVADETGKRVQRNLQEFTQQAWSY